MHDDDWTPLLKVEGTGELTIEDLDRAFEKLVGRKWNSWPSLYLSLDKPRQWDYLPLDMWDETP
jgi:hypothetical protein